MKKNIKLMGLLLMAGMAFTACSSDDIEEQANSQQGNKTWTATMDVAKGLDTRTLTLDGTSLNVGWSASEKVYVYNNSNELVGTLSPISNSSESSVSMTGIIEGNSWSSGDVLKLRFPREEVDYTGQDGQLSTIAAKYDYATGTTTPTTVSSNHIQLMTTNLTSQQAIVKFTFPWAVKMMSVYADGGVMSEPIIVVPTSATTTLYVAVPIATAAKANYVITAVKASDNKEYIKKKINITMQNGKYYTCDLTSLASPAYLDLGLSASWYLYNLDMTSTTSAKLTFDVTKQGSLFAWGETATKSTYTLNNYQYYDSSTGKYTKYVMTGQYGDMDGRGSLEVADDAAYQIDINTRMPNKVLIQELDDQTKCFKNEFTMGGTNYILVTSKVTGKEGLSLIFRADDMIWTSVLKDLGSTATTWYPGGNGSSYGSLRYKGNPIRPVR